MDPNKRSVNPEAGKTASIISYFSIIGWLVAYFAVHQNNKTSLGSFQLRQTLLLHIVAIIVYYGMKFTLRAVVLPRGPFYMLHNAALLVDLGFIILWILGLTGAINGKKKLIPLVGHASQTLFSAI